MKVEDAALQLEQMNDRFVVVCWQDANAYCVSVDDQMVGQRVAFGDAFDADQLAAMTARLLGCQVRYDWSQE